MVPKDSMPKLSRYVQIIEHIFAAKYKKGLREISFERDELVSVASSLGLQLPKNLGDLIYTFRFRSDLPASIVNTAGVGQEWIIRLSGAANYKIVLVQKTSLTPDIDKPEIKVPDATPGIVTMYALNDEQALLAKIRYNRLIDIFTGLTCYSLQSHLRTTVPGIGQLETDEIYIGVDRSGAHTVCPVQAKGGTDRMSIVQIEQDYALCAAKFPTLIHRPIAAQFMADNVIALFDFEPGDDRLHKGLEKHYRLVAPEEITQDELLIYRKRMERAKNADE
jgi:hypothetical protein